MAIKSGAQTEDYNYGSVNITLESDLNNMRCRDGVIIPWRLK
jgi:hypothetical protein